MLASLVLVLAMFVALGATLNPGSTQLEVTWKMVLVGLGLGPSVPLYVLAVQNAVPASEIGVATSAVTFFRQIGASLGITLLSAVFAARLAHAAAPSPAWREAVSQATRGVFGAAAVLVAIAAVLSWLIPELPMQQQR